MDALLRSHLTSNEPLRILRSLQQLPPEKFAHVQEYILQQLNDTCIITERASLLKALCIIGDTRINPLAPDMILVPAGNTVIGTDKEDILSLQKNHSEHAHIFTREHPRHAVHVPVFTISKYPVTNKEYAHFIIATGREKPAWWPRTFPKLKANHPVYGITLSDAHAYCAWLSQQTNKTYRLPTEIEWEKAARGHDSRTYPWGNEYALTNANTHDNKLNTTSAVGTFIEGTSMFGCDDIAGNVAEMTTSTLTPYEHHEFEGVTQNTSIIVKSGAYNEAPYLSRCATRRTLDEVLVVGFRLVATIE